MYVCCCRVCIGVCTYVFMCMGVYNILSKVKLCHHASAFVCVCVCVCVRLYRYSISFLPILVCVIMLSVCIHVGLSMRTRVGLSECAHMSVYCKQDVHMCETDGVTFCEAEQHDCHYAK